MWGPALRAHRTSGLRWPFRPSGRWAIEAWLARLLSGLPGGWRRPLRSRGCAAIEIGLGVRAPSGLAAGGLGPLRSRWQCAVDVRTSWQFSAAWQLRPRRRSAGGPLQCIALGTLGWPGLMGRDGVAARCGCWWPRWPSRTPGLVCWQRPVGLSQRNCRHWLDNLRSRMRPTGVHPGLLSAPPLRALPLGPLPWGGSRRRRSRSLRPACARLVWCGTRRHFTQGRDLGWLVYCGVGTRL